MWYFVIHKEMYLVSDFLGQEDDTVIGVYQKHSPLAL